MADATVKEIKEFFGMSLTDFKREWSELPERDRKDLREGIGNGTLTY